MEPTAEDEYADWDGASTIMVAPNCAGCGEPVGWRDLRWTPVTDGERVTVVSDGEPWHLDCRAFAAGRALVAEVRAGVLVGRATGRAFVHFGASLVPPVVAGVHGIVGGSWPVLVERGRAVVSATRTFVPLARRVGVRRLRGLPFERIGWPVEVAAGTVVTAAAEGVRRWRHLRFRVTDGAAEWGRAVGYTRAWRALLNGDDPGPLAPVDAEAWEQWGFIWRGRTNEAANPSDSAPVAGWFGPIGHGDVDPPDGRRGHGR